MRKTVHSRFKIGKQDFNQVIFPYDTMEYLRAQLDQKAKEGKLLVIPQEFAESKGRRAHLQDDDLADGSVVGVVQSVQLKDERLVFDIEFAQHNNGQFFYALLESGVPMDALIWITVSEDKTSEIIHNPDKSVEIYPSEILMIPDHIRLDRDRLSIDNTEKENI